jgi:hypothetical protein
VLLNVISVAFAIDFQILFVQSVEYSLMLPQFIFKMLFVQSVQIIYFCSQVAAAAAAAAAANQNNNGNANANLNMNANMHANLNANGGGGGQPAAADAAGAGGLGTSGVFVLKHDHHIYFSRSSALSHCVGIGTGFLSVY